MSVKQLEAVSIIPKDEPRALVPVNPMEMLSRAVESGADIEMIEKLMGLSERWDASNARKNFERAMSAAKAEIPVIIRSAEGHNSKKYADFAAIAKVIDPIIGRHGLSYRFRTVQTDKAITVTCVLFGHGHSEETTLSGPADTTGNKNAIQAIGSTLTYLQRYSLVQMLGLAAAADDDGKAADAGEVVSDDQLKQLIALADEVGADKEKFCVVMKVPSFADIRANEFKRAVDLLNTKRRAAK